MLGKFDNILEVGKKRTTRLAYSIWDIITFPEAVHFEQSDSSFRFSYDLHTTLFGPPNQELLDRYNPIGTISLSFDPEWLELVMENFSAFEAMDKSAKDKEMNTFLSMELIQQDFKCKETYDSQILDEDLIKGLSFKQRLLFSNSEGGGVGIMKDSEILGVAFTPHIVNNDQFSFAIIRGVWVSQAHRNKGYGYDVSAKMCEVLFDNGIEKVTLWVEESNTPAVSIYEKMGFKTVEEVYGTDCIKTKR
ncbi:MAG: GNAT family N-acetyltransferase [Candidatus Heimdallarchaeaceae archaeon]